MADFQLYFRGEDFGKVSDTGWSIGVGVQPQISTILDHDSLEEQPRVIGADMVINQAGSQSYTFIVTRTSSSTMQEVCRAVAILEGRVKGTRGVLKLEDSVLDIDATCTSVTFSSSGMIFGDSYQIQLNFTGIGNIGGDSMQFYEQLMNGGFEALDNTSGNIPFITLDIASHDAQFDVDTGASKGTITDNGATGLYADVEPGNTIIVTGTADNDGTYIVDTATSTVITTTTVITGGDGQELTTVIAVKKSYARDWALTANGATATVEQLIGTEIIGNGQLAVKMTAHATPAADAPLIAQIISEESGFLAADYANYYLRVSVDVALENKTTTPSTSVLAISLKENTSAGNELAYSEYTLYSNRRTTCTLTIAVADLYSNDLYIGISCCANSTLSSVIYVDNVRLKEIYETEL